MEKVIRNGKVAVLYSPGYGAGWYSWHDIKELMYDPIVVDMVERKEPDNVIESYCEEKYGDDAYFAKYGDDAYFGGAEDLQVEWIPIGTKFRIAEYDGAESIEYYDETKWEIAE
jgi:hypothetical protein